MNVTALRPLASLLFLAAPLAAADFTVHEWGTFTSIVGSDGRMLPGLEVEEESLPAFVHSFAGFSPRNKGWDRPLAGVTVKVETPVLYFYSDTPLSARVSVGFHGGAISQWYPDRAAGEEIPLRDLAPNQPPAGPPIDFSAGHEGAATWQVDVLPHDGAPPTSAPKDWETRQWPRARVPAANRVRVGREVEGFIFYRGVGNFTLPLKVRCAPDGGLLLTNEGRQAMPFLWVYEKKSASAAPASWTGELAAGETRATGPRRAQPVAFADALVRAGLSADEARALLATWRESYFDRPGLRVFWIVPREFTNAILPIDITPRPAHLARVLVGRTEVMTPAFETTLLRDFNRDGGKRWADDRYLHAYQERVRQLRATLGQMAATP